MVKAILITIIILTCIFFIINMIDQKIVDEALKSQALAKQYLNNNKLLLKIIQHIYSQLNLLKLKDCPDEEFKNIPFEMIDWIEELGVINAKK